MLGTPHACLVLPIHACPARFGLHATVTHTSHGGLVAVAEKQNVIVARTRKLSSWNLERGNRMTTVRMSVAQPARRRGTSTASVRITAPCSSLSLFGSSGTEWCSQSDAVPTTHPRHPPPTHPPPPPCLPDADWCSQSNAVPGSPVPVFRSGSGTPSIASSLVTPRCPRPRGALRSRTSPMVRQLRPRLDRIFSSMPPHMLRATYSAQCP